MYILKILVDAALCASLVYVVKKIKEFLFYRYIEGVDGYTLGGDDLFIFLVAFVVVIALFIASLRMRKNVTTRVFNLLGLGVAIAGIVVSKWKSGDTGENVLTTVIPGLVGAAILEFILMAL